MNKASLRKQGRVWPVHLALVLLSFITLAPFVWMLLTSFKTFEESVQMPPDILPQAWNLINYRIVLNKFPFAMFYWNTFAMMGMTVAVQLVVCSMAGYAFARLQFPGKEFLFTLCLALLMVPGQIFLVPHYDIMVRLKLTNSITALWLPKIFSAFGTFMLRQFFQGLPKSLDEAAMIDGSGFFGIYARILLPLVKPALISLAILTALSAFKDLMWPLIVNNAMDKMTLSAGLAMLIGEHTTIYPQVMAGSALAVWPMILLFLMFQKHFVEGIALTGIK
ncbi:MAG: carbohydrate ABC transporter permease [Christensenellales bacterium]|nr:carbohydrate ABC transporter permease [Clostridiales bacterium]